MTQTAQDAVRILRAYEGEQITQGLIDHQGARCAMGVLGGADLTLDNEDICWRGLCDSVEFKIGAEFGFDDGQIEDILEWNDMGACSFNEIAARIEAGEWS